MCKVSAKNIFWKKWHPSSGILRKNLEFSNLKSDFFGKFSTFPFFTKIPKFYLSEPTSVQSFSEKKEPFSSFIIHHSSFIIMINSASVQCSTYLYDKQVKPMEGLFLEITVPAICRQKVPIWTRLPWGVWFTSSALFLNISSLRLASVLSS